MNLPSLRNFDNELRIEVACLRKIFKNANYGYIRLLHLYYLADSLSRITKPVLGIGFADESGLCNLKSILRTVNKFEGKNLGNTTG